VVERWRKKKNGSRGGEKRRGWKGGRRKEGREVGGGEDAFYVRHSLRGYP
jgi:hypothetical protein